MMACSFIEREVERENDLKSDSEKRTDRQR